MKSRFQKTQQERIAINQFRVRWIGKLRNELRMDDAVEQCGNREEKTHDGSRSTNVKQRTIGAHGGSNHDECAKGAGQVGEGNKERIAGAKMMVTASKEMSQLMREQDAQQRGRKGKPREQTGRVFVEKGEAAEESADRCGLIVRIGDGKLRSRHQACAQSQQEEHYGENKRFLRRAGRNLGVIPFADEIVVPIQASG